MCVLRNFGFDGCVNLQKRRRSRVNEKMKALQKLIPNSNKTDKASMLDEAIEYLKKLQLRVQDCFIKEPWIRRGGSTNEFTTEIGPS